MADFLTGNKIRSASKEKEKFQLGVAGGEKEERINIPGISGMPSPQKRELGPSGM